MRYFGGLVLLYVALIVGGIVGYVKNIIQVFEMADAGITGMFVLKVIGVVIPFLGAVLGYVG
jgi:hypothetical protein